jgi:hypothetical protein
MVLKDTLIDMNNCAKHFPHLKNKENEEILKKSDKPMA